MDWFGLPCSPRDSQESSLIPHFKSIILWCSSFFMVQISHLYMTTGKTIALITQIFFDKVISQLFNTLSRLVHSSSSKEQASFNFMAVVTICSNFGAQENKVCHSLHCFPVYFPWSDGTRCHEFFECWVLSQIFHSPLSPSTKGSLVLLRFLP